MKKRKLKLRARVYLMAFAIFGLMLLRDSSVYVQGVGVFTLCTSVYFGLAVWYDSAKEVE